MALFSVQYRRRGKQRHKWHCSLLSIEEEESNDLKQTFAKETLGTKTGEAKILTLKWNKSDDRLALIPEAARRRGDTQREES